ncbi:hypothetical protein CHARACLAT_021487 [Characodon lateralis]|uniref:Uncharacterized protein n=1 Tax=Characodon lateralis TaxID=208331 RepID=A0ABU7EVM0_9TELE|nr:hypothetical protein [Characodon lateralis]
MLLDSFNSSSHESSSSLRPSFTLNATHRQSHTDVVCFSRARNRSQKQVQDFIPREIQDPSCASERPASDLLPSSDLATWARRSASQLLTIRRTQVSSPF